MVLAEQPNIQPNIAETNVTEMSQALEAVLTKGIVLRASRKEVLKQLEQIAAAVGSKVYTGKVALAGQIANGSLQVQFNADNGMAYASTWPQWAFELAKLSLLHGRKLLVIANGGPFGSNLIQVFLFAA